MLFEVEKILKDLLGEDALENSEYNFMFIQDILMEYLTSDRDVQFLIESFRNNDVCGLKLLQIYSLVGAMQDLKEKKKKKNDGN